MRERSTDVILTPFWKSNLSILLENVKATEGGGGQGEENVRKGLKEEKTAISRQKRRTTCSKVVLLWRGGTVSAETGSLLGTKGGKGRKLILRDWSIP